MEGGRGISPEPGNSSNMLRAWGRKERSTVVGLGGGCRGVAWRGIELQCWAASHGTRRLMSKRPRQVVRGD